MALSLNSNNTANTLNLALYNEIRTLTEEVNSNNNVDLNYTAKICRNKKGNIERINYYNKYNKLVKSANYFCSELTNVKTFQKEYAYVEEIWEENKLAGREYRDENDNVLYSVAFEYSKSKITKITQTVGENTFAVEYTYDSYDRVNSRTIYENGQKISTQEFTLDVIDRVISYKDENKKIFVWQMSTVNEIEAYSIVDKNGVERVVKNTFEENEYVGTEITIGNIKRNVIDVKFTDNVIFKKPSATEDDLTMVKALFSNKH